MLDFDGHISTLNVNGSDRNIVFQTDLPIFGMTVCPDGQHALFVKPTKDTKALNVYQPGRRRREVHSDNERQVRPESGCARPTASLSSIRPLVNGKKLLMSMPLEWWRSHGNCRMNS